MNAARVNGSIASMDSTNIPAKAEHNFTDSFSALKPF